MYIFICIISLKLHHERTAVNMSHFFGNTFLSITFTCCTCCEKSFIASVLQ